MRTKSKDARSTALVAVSKQQAETNLARKVLQLSKYVKGMRPEMKFVDLNLSQTNVSQVAGTSQLMSAIAAGAGVNQRIGENVQVRYIELHFEAIFLSSIAVATNDNPSYRLYIVQDKQQVQNASPAVADLVDAPSLPTIQLFNVQEQKRFRVIYDSGPQVMKLHFTPFAIFDNFESSIRNSSRSAFLEIYLVLVPLVTHPYLFRPDFLSISSGVLVFLSSITVLQTQISRRMEFISWCLRICWPLQRTVSIIIALLELVLLTCKYTQYGGSGGAAHGIRITIQPNFFSTRFVFPAGAQPQGLPSQGRRPTEQAGGRAPYYY